MTHLAPLASATLLGVTLLGAALGVRRIEIPGWLSITVVALGIGLNLFLSGAHGVVIALAGLILAVSTYLMLHRLRVVGISQLKLAAPIGAIVGPWNWLIVVLLAVVIGIPISIAIALSTSQLHQTGATKAIVIRDFCRFMPPYNVTDNHPGRHGGFVIHHDALLAIGVLSFLSITTALALR